MTTTEQKLDNIVQRFERDNFYDKIKEVVAESIEDLRYADNADVKRIEDKLVDIEDQQIEIKAELLDLRKLIEDELGKISKGLSLVLGMQDA